MSDEKLFFFFNVLIPGQDEAEAATGNLPHSSSTSSLHLQVHGSGPHNPSGASIGDGNSSVDLHHKVGALAKVYSFSNAINFILIVGQSSIHEKDSTRF